MKKYIVILLLTAAIHSKAQLSVGDETVSEIMVLKTDTMSVQKSFALLEKLCSGKMWAYDRKVIFEGKTYFQFGVQFRKQRRTWLIEGNRMRRL